MGILQNLKDTFFRYFPLHLNETVQALEDENDSLLDAVEHYVDLLDAAKRHIQDLQTGNRMVLRENTYMNGVLRAAHGVIQGQQKELDDLYSSMTPKLSSWPMPVSAHLEESHMGVSFIRVELPPLRLHSAVNEAVRRGLYTGYLDAFAERIATTAYKEVKGAVHDLLLNVLPIKKETNV